MNRIGATLMGTAAALACAVAPLTAQTWTSWTNNTTCASDNWCGDLSGTDIGFSATSISGGQLTGAGGTDYWSPADAYLQGGIVNAPDAGGNLAFIQMNDAFSGTITFGSVVHNPLVAWISVGQSGIPIELNFGNSPFTLISDNTTADIGAGSCPYYTCGTNNVGINNTSSALIGTEFSGVMEFLGDYTSISFTGGAPAGATTPPDEFWYGFTVGINGPESATPEPGTMAMMATGLVGLMGAGIRRRRRNR
ncbi:MAG TPA: PEP-CTERM sorting domain-containing protein [Gemmatimonadales bacterium]|jgi:hypothetical protein